MKVYMFRDVGRVVALSGTRLHLKEPFRRLRVDKDVAIERTVHSESLPFFGQLLELLGAERLPEERLLAN